MKEANPLPIVLHQVRHKVVNKIGEMKIEYKGIYIDILYIQNFCPACLQKNIRFYNRQPVKQILMNKPEER